FRLPLASLPHVPPEHYPYYQPQAPLEARGALPEGAEGGPRTANGSGVTGVAVRTALAVEPRDGIVHVFMP
ncbi:transglutaminase family protein, partial [Raoultella ornithinolytica]|uniref:transglutaminase family protein n=1 Tax=Raoultella ornithinolytica TaxID=54291 RepID=UPI0013DC168E